MRKRTSQLEWQFVENQDDWDAAQRTSAMDTMPSGSVVQHRPYRSYVWAGLLVLLLLLASAGGWLWRTAQAGLNEIEGELSSTVQIELASVAPVSAPPGKTWTTDPAAMVWKKQLERDRTTLHTLLPPDTPAIPLVQDVQTISLLGNQAVIEFVTTAGEGTQPYGQTRFYRYSAEGWQRTMPDDELWGAPHRLESDYFVYHFRQNDAEVVAAVAPQIDALYAELQRNFGLTPVTEKLVIEVTVEHATGAVLTPRWESEPLVVPSPALYFAPVDLSDSAILAQSIALPLIDYMGERAIENHTIPTRWQPLLNGLRLWQLWNLDMPLAYWQQDLVKWIYVDAPKAAVEQRSMLPTSYTELCAMHSLWMLSPAFIAIPLKCNELDALIWSPNRWSAFVPRIRLDELSMPQTDWNQPFAQETNNPYYYSETVVIATLIEYAVKVYGVEHLPVLLAGLPQYDTWETLIPAVYGVSPSEFEQGWRTFMAKEYGMQP